MRAGASFEGSTFTIAGLVRWRAFTLVGSEEGEWREATATNVERNSMDYRVDEGSPVNADKVTWI